VYEWQKVKMTMPTFGNKNNVKKKKLSSSTNCETDSNNSAPTSTSFSDLNIQIIDEVTKLQEQFATIFKTPYTFDSDLSSIGNHLNHLSKQMRACFNNSSITLTTLTHLLNQNQIILTENQLLKVQNEEILRRLEFTVDQNSRSMAKIQQILVKFLETSKSIFETSKTIYDQSQDNLKFQQQLQYQVSTIQKLQQIFFRNSPPSLLLLEYLYLLLITRL
jgi:DNA polymerase III alpha subunit (gram-positive type)